MKTAKRILIFLVALIATMGAWADVIEVGVEGENTTGYLPSYSLYNYSMSQQIYTPEEIGYSGTINGISFYSNRSTTRSLDIYMLHGKISDFESSGAFSVTASDLVFSGDITWTANNWTTITLDTPFAYNGKDNLILVVNDKTGNWTSTVNFRIYETETQQAIYAYNDNNAYDPTAPSEYTFKKLNTKNQLKLDMSNVSPLTFGFDLSVGKTEHGTIELTVGGAAAEEAGKDAEVTVTVTPDEGWTINEVVARPYTSWDVAKAPSLTPEILKIELVPVDGVNNQWTFTMPAYAVEVSATYLKLLSHTDITVDDIAAVTYNGQEQKPTVVVKDGSTTLTKGTDYTVEYSNNINAAEATVENAPTVTITGMGNYAESVIAKFTINPATLTAAVLEETNLVYNKEEQAAVVASVTAGTLDVPAEGYDMTENTATNVGNYKAKVTGKGNFTGTVEAPFCIVPADANLFTLTIEPDEFTYDGEAKTPAVTVKDGDDVLTENTDYTLTITNNVNAGTATVSAIGMGNYTGTKTGSFTIKKAQPVVTFSGEEEYDVLLKEPFVSPVATIEPEGLPIVYSSSDEDLATVDPATGEVAFVGTGIVTITAAFEGNDNYEPAEDSYTIYIERREFTVDFSKEPNNGTVTLSAKKAFENDVITATVLPNAGYVIQEVEIVTDGGKTVEFTEASGEKEREVVYTFSMPYDNVTVNVKFENKNVEGRKVTVGDGNTYTIANPDAKTVVVTKTDSESNVIVIPATIYDAETGVEYTVTGVANDAFEGRNSVTDVYVENKKDLVDIDGAAFVKDMPNAKLHVYQTLLGDYADMVSELLEGKKLVTDIENKESLFTFSNGTNVEIPENVKQYICQVTTATVPAGVAAAPGLLQVKALTVGSQVVNANTGVLLEAESGVHEFAAVAEAGDGSYEGNELKALPLATVINSQHVAYIVKDGKFQAVEEGFIITEDGKAILVISGTNQPSTLSIELVEIPTGIKTIDNEQLTIDNCYDMSGRKLSNGQLPKGLYIVNGKKVVIK